LLLREENVSHRGKFHSIERTTSLPRPTQLPRPKFYVAALTTPDSFAFAGRMGYSVMAIPMAGGKMRELIAAYREAWGAAGHPGAGEVMLAFHMFCDPDGARAREMARRPLDAYLRSLVDAAADWTEGLSSTDYPGYDKVIAKLKEASMESMVASGAAWIGSPAEIREAVGRLAEEYGRFEHASLQVNFNTVPREAGIGSRNREALPSPAPGRSYMNGDGNRSEEWIMSLQDRIQTLRAKHADLEADIRQETARPWPDDIHLIKLKRQKLRIKDMIAVCTRRDDAPAARP